MMHKFIFFLLLISWNYCAYTQDYGAEILEQKTTIEIKGNKLVKNYFYQIKINNRSSEKLTKISIPFSKMYKLSNVEGFITNKSGNIIRKLKSSDCTVRSAVSDYSFYEDDFVKEFTLKHNDYPYILTYSFTLTQEQFIYIDYWTPMYHHDFPTQQASLKVTVPKKYKIAFSSSDSLMSKMDSSETAYIYTWSGSCRNTVEDEYFAPSYYTLVPKVKMVPLEFYFEIEGKQTNWIEFGNWQNEICKPLRDLPPSEKNAIDQLISDKTNKKEMVKTLYHYLQDRTRYINVTIETGGLKPYPASYVSTNKYGDCKALSNYFKSMMDYIGIPAYYVLVNSGQHIPETNTEFTSSQFNHAMVVVYLPNDTLWLDCTSNMAFGYYGTFTQNRKALVIKEDASAFQKIPVLKPVQCLESRKVNIEAFTGSVVLVEFNNIYKGARYEELFGISKQLNETQRQQILHEEFAEKGFTDLSKLTIHPFHRDSTSIKFSYNATASKLFRNYGNETIVDLIPFNLPNLEKPNNRKLPVQVDYPIYLIDTLIYKIPVGKHISSKFSDQTSTEKYGSYSIRTQLKENEIVVIKEFLLYQNNYPLSEYPAFYKFITNYKNTESNSHIILN